MGSRPKGKVKKKSIKAALGPDAGSKRKLSRMGKKQKKDHGYIDATYIGRSKCLKMLQIDLKDFRRLCILKGIYPRDPPEGRVPGKKKGQSFYHIKDIRAIAHEPILDKFRDFKAFMKKVRRAAGRNERDEAVRKNALLPTYTLHHLVKERYPRFVDALGDLDDALTLTYLFASLPGEVGNKASGEGGGAGTVHHHNQNIRPGVISKAKSLAAAWGAYCSTMSCITKSFISVKGVYLEATIQNVPIRWIVPHSFTQYIPPDVDFRIMKTFLEFYETLLNFVMYKLYNDMGVRYPFRPLTDLQGVTAGSTSALLGANLRALTNALQSENTISKVVTATIESNQDPTKSANGDKSSKTSSNTDKKKTKELVKSVGAALNSLVEEEDGDEEDGQDDDDDESVDVAGPLQAALENVAQEEARSSLSGGSGGSSKNKSDNGAMDIVDDETIKRKRLFAGLTFFFSREIPRGYIELICLSYGGKVGWEGGLGGESPIGERDPSITHHVVDRPKLPTRYDTLPKSREYVQPQWILDCANNMFILPVTRYTVGATLPPHLSPWVDDEEEGYKPAYAEEIERLKNGESVPIPETSQEKEKESDDRAANDEPMEDIDAIQHEEKNSEKNKEEEEEEEEEDDEEEEEEEEDAEAAKKRLEKKRKKEEEEAHALAKTMMNKKAARLYGRMQHGIARKKEKIDTLKQRRKDIEEKIEQSATAATTASAGKKTAQKQKVERLKKERKSIEDEYEATGGSMKKARKSR